MMRITLLLALLTACRGDYSAPAFDATSNAQPLAQAGIGTRVQVGTTVTLDGSGSFDPDGDALTYAWHWIERPPQSIADAASVSAPTTSFVADKLGTYRFGLDVQDADGATSHDEVVIESVLELVLPMLSVSAGADATTGWLSRVHVTGSVTAAEGYTPTHQWTIIERPAASNTTLDDPTSLTPSFFADARGQYTLELRATAGSETKLDTVVVTTSTAAVAIGDFHTIEYSSALDRFVGIRNNPAQISVVDPTTGVAATVSIPFQLSATLGLALHPSGLRAVVGGYEQLATITLQPLAVEQVFDVPLTNDRVVFGSDNRVHSVPPNLGYSLYTVNVGTGAVTTAVSFGDSPFVAVHPSGAAMYVLDSFTPSMARYDLTSAPIANVREATFGSLAGPLFPSQDGALLVASSGQVLRSSSSAATDMTVLGSLGISAIYSVAHSAARHEIVTVNDVSSVPVVTWFDDTTLAPRLTLPLLQNDGNRYYGGRVAVRADGTRLYMVGYGVTSWDVFTVSPPP